ncbi:DUF4817 domain-containing protein [Trichonephila clavipes]|nr:DUF4817 domain-containing protein [Trichonephila clavipes]
MILLWLKRKRERDKAPMVAEALDDPCLKTSLEDKAFEDIHRSNIQEALCRVEKERLHRTEWEPINGDICFSKDGRIGNVCLRHNPKWRVNINVALFNYARAFGDGPRHFEPWSSDKDDTRAGTPSPNYHTNGSTFEPRHISRATVPHCQVIYSQFGLAIHQNDHQARRRFIEWAQNEIAVVPDFHKRILFSDEAHFWLNGYVNKQNCRIWSEANPQVYVETPLHPEKLTVWGALWTGGILLQKR